MSDSGEENFCFYGKPLEPYDEDAFPKKRPITVEEQVATDSKGRRRFHGAFTGGFSAGFFNTVGSLEGWLPAEFKSSRGEKQKHVAQNPEDFMDDEDMGEFGFASQSIRATKDYDTSKKRKRKIFSDGPIPGEPVLHTLLTAGNETVGYLLLKNIGIKEKIKTQDEECSTSNRVYGCEIPKSSSLSETFETKDYELSDFYNLFLNNPKNDTFSLGYIGLDKSKVNLFRSSDLIIHEKNKKLSIRGQAFGVGAFENDDDDIYAKEDMSNYDFELTKEKEKSKCLSNNSTDRVFDAFVKSKLNTFKRDIYPPPVIPKSFIGKHKVKKSRFEPIEMPEPKTIDRRKINSFDRAQLLDEEINKNVTSSKPALSNSLKESVKKESSSNEFDIQKSESIGTTKPLNFDPNNLWNDRFVTGSQEDEATNILAPVKKYEDNHYSKEMKDAAKMKMFGPLTRISEDWQPCSLLCKRFNVPEPFSDKPSTSQNRIKMKNLIFEYQKHHEENVAFKSGLTQVATEGDDGNELKNNSPSEKQEDIQDSIEISGTQVMEIKQEVIEVEKDNKNIEHTESKQLDDVIDITDRLHIEDKRDLFKAVFLSSSESEDEEDEYINMSEKKDDSCSVRELELKSNILGDELQLPKIKPIKDGILSGLNFKNTPVFDEPKISNDFVKTKTNTEVDLGVSPSTYGPKLPENLKLNSVNKIAELSLKKYSGSSSDEWIEKEDLGKVKTKKHKKNKLHKKKQKHKKNKKKY